MPTRVIDGKNPSDYAVYTDQTGDPALLITGSNPYVLLYSHVASTGAGPAVLLAGMGVHFRVESGARVTAGATIAIQGSDYRDEIINNGGTISGNVLLGGGHDHFQNNRASAVGQVFGGEGHDALTAFEGTVALSYFGEEGDDYLGGGSAGDLLDGGDDRDVLVGGGGDDQLNGGAGDDRLEGGLGDDRLIGGGGEDDVAIFDGFMADFAIDLVGGTGTVTDLNASDGDQGSDELSGILTLRFTDQEVDLRLVRNALVLTTPGETYVNSVGRYDYFAVELRGEESVLVNEAYISGTAVPHNVLGPYGYQSAATGAVALFVHNATIENRAGASISAFDDAIGSVAMPNFRSGDGLRVINHGLISSSEANAISFDSSVTVTNGATGMILAERGNISIAIATPNAHAHVVNAGTIVGRYASIDAGLVDLQNSGSITGKIFSGIYLSEIVNSGYIRGGYEAWGGLTLLNTGQSIGNLLIDVYPVGQFGYGAYTFADIDNRGSFTGDIRITGAANFLTAPDSHVDFLAVIANSGILTGSIVSDPTLRPLTGGGTPDASFVESVVNSGTITGDVRLGDGDDSLVNSGTIGGLVDGGAGDDSLEGGAGSDRLQGGSGNDVVRGGGGDDVLRLQHGGDDSVFAGAGNDALFFIGSLTSADLVDGGAGVDTLVLQAPSGPIVLTSNVTGIENVSLLGGNNTSFGDPGNNLYDYELRTHDSNFAAGVQARINGAALLAGEDFVFDGSAETDSSYVVYGGKGKDTLLGGQGNDIFFYAEERFASGDTVNGGTGYDGMFLRGNYTIDFNAPGFTGLFTNIDNLTLTSATDERYARGGGTEFDYNLTLSDAIVGAGGLMTVSGALLLATETMILDASAETDGTLRLFGGKASDTLKGGALADLIHGNLGADILAGGGGADAFRYQNVAESNSASMDQILDLTPGTDKIELDRIDADTLTAGNQAFSWIGSNAFTGSAGQLRAYEQGGTWFVEGDTDGDGNADLVIALTLQGPTPLTAGDFLL